MKRTTVKLAILAMLPGIAGVICVAGWSGNSPRPEPTAPALATTLGSEPKAVVIESPRPQIQSETPRLSVSFNDETSATAALLKSVPAADTSAHRADIDVWYGQYSEHDFRVLPASPVEKEPSRLNVKFSFAF